MERRTFVKISSMYSAGLILFRSVPVDARGSGQPPICFQPHPLLKLCDDGSIIVYVRKQEMGQGINTSLPMIVAEELDARWKDVSSAIAPFEFDSRHDYTTWASKSVKDNWLPMRKAGAAAREMLVQEAAKRWNIDSGLCITRKSKVINSMTKEEIAYKDLVEGAAKLPVPEDPQLKNFSEFKIVGRSKGRINAREIVMGKTLFSMDFVLPDMLSATILRCPVYGGMIKSYDATKALAMEGVVKVVEIEPMEAAKVGHGLAVIADSFWTSQKALQHIDIEWDLGENRHTSSEQFLAQLKANVDGEDTDVLVELGDPYSEYRNAKIKSSLLYEYPFLAHAPLETPNCTARYEKGKFEVWGGFQVPRFVAEKLPELFGIEREDLQIHLMLMGGGFGRRASFDNAAEAMQLARVVDKPIKVYWTRVDDMKHDAYRPAAVTRIQAALNSKNQIVSWENRTSGSAFLKDAFNTEEVSKGQRAFESIGGGGGDFYYPVLNFKSSFKHENAPVITGPWRSVGYSVNNFSVESTIDDLADKAKVDPLKFRLNLLAKNEQTEFQTEIFDNTYNYSSQRLINLLKKVAEEIGWDRPREANHYYGIACCPYLNAQGYAAHAFDISILENKKIKINRVVAGIDCGKTINPDGVRAQMEGALIWGLSAALKGEITIKDGRVEQSTFGDYPILRYNEAPKMKVVIMESDEDPGSVGEVGVPSVAPALCNAIFFATGERITKLPIVHSGYELLSGGF